MEKEMKWCFAKGSQNNWARWGSSSGFQIVPRDRDPAFCWN